MDIFVRKSPTNRLFYTHGDVVRGDVVLHDCSTANGVKASINFIGMARTTIGVGINTNKPSHAVETVLFQYTEYLNFGRRGKEGFEFTFPAGVVSTPQRQRYSNDSNFQTTPGHALPPSFSQQTRPDEPDHNTVTYTLSVTITTPHPTARKAKKSLRFSPVRDIEHYQPISTPIVTDLRIKGRHHHHLGSTDHERTSHSPPSHPLGNDHHHHHHHSLNLHFHHLSISLLAETPEIACAGATLPLCIGAVYTESRSAVQPLPTIYIRNVLVSLEALTRVRTPSTHHHRGLGLSHEPQESWNEVTQLVDTGVMGAALPARHPDIRAKIEGVGISDGVVPTFRTFNIARTYVLRVEVQAEVAGELMEVRMERGVVVLPAVSLAAAVVVERSWGREGVGGRTAVGEELPPSYEECVGGDAGGLRGMQRLPNFEDAVNVHLGGEGREWEE